MKRKALAVVLTLMMVVSLLPMAAFADGFTDVSQDFWAKDAIDRWTDYDVLNGTGSDTFSPNDFLTRAQAAAIFTRLLQLTDTVDVSNFTDVESGSWYEPYVARAVAAGIMNGTSATTFDPDGTISRQDFFLILARAVGIQEESTCNYTGFDDLNQLSSYARGSVYALINHDYVHGRSATQLAPLAPITRASAAQVLDNVIEYYITENGTYELEGDGVALVLADTVTLTGPNFTGTIVAAKDGSNIDGSALTGGPTLNITADNVVATLPEGAVVYVASNEDNAVVNGQKLASGKRYTVGPNGAMQGETTPPVNPTPVTPTPSGGGNNGGHSGGSSGGTTTYNVTLTMKVDTFAPQLTAEYDADTNFGAVVSDLFSGENKNAVKNAFSAFIGSLDGTSHDYGDYNVSISGSTVTVTGPNVDCSAFVANEHSLYVARMNDVVKGAANVSNDAAWTRVVNAFDPLNYFADSTASTLTMKTPEQYADMAEEMGNALENLYLQDNGVNYDGLFGTDGIFWLYYVPSNQMNAHQDILQTLKDAGKQDLLDPSFATFNDASELQSAIEKIFDRDYSGTGTNAMIGQAILNAAYSNGVTGLQMTIEVA